jgi:hypothetical protein
VHRTRLRRQNIDRLLVRRLYIHIFNI